MAWTLEAREEFKKRNPEYHKEYIPEWNKANPERLKGYYKAYRERYPERVKAAQAAYRLKNKARTAARDRVRREKSPEKVKAVKDSWRKKNLVRVAQTMKEWRGKNKERVKEFKRESWKRIGRQTRKKRMQTDIAFKLTVVLRQRLRTAIKQAKLGKMQKSGSIAELVGCALPFLIEYLEAQFLPGMSWENHGFDGWHIDHIRPCSSFNLLDRQEQKECFHFKNLQPLWACDNISKHAKWEEVAA